MIELCFWCGRPKSGIREEMIKILEGKEPSEFRGYKACAGCSKEMGKGVTVVEVCKEAYMAQPEMSKGLYPTGKWVVVDIHSLKGKFPNEALEKIKEGSFFLIGIEDFRKNGYDPDYLQIH